MLNNFEDKYIKLKTLLENAYEIYSHFPVSSIIETIKDNEYFGVNVENASYPNTICAERNAIGNAITNEGKNMKIAKVFLLSKSSDIIIPCGMCLQVISEFVTKNTEIIAFDLNKNMKIFTFNQLFPQFFNKKNLGDINEK